MNILKIAFRNLNRQKRRSILLLLAIAFAFLIVTLIDGVAAGAMKGLEQQIIKLAGGHVYVTGAEKSADKSEDDDATELLRSTELIDKALKEIGVKPIDTTIRVEAFGTFIFEGNQSSSPVFGCIFDNEKLLTESITFKEGNWESMKKENAILMSESIVKELQIQLHDIILMETKTFSGQSTVAEFQLEGISKDKNLIAAQVGNYANLYYINKIRKVPEGVFSDYNIFLDDIKKQETVAYLLESKIGEYAPVTSRQKAKINSPKSPGSNLREQLNTGKWEGTKYCVSSISDQVPLLTKIIVVVNMISFVILLVLLLITMIGVSNTFRMIVHERKSEIGTMRSCGVTRRSVKWLFITEALLLSILGAVVGITIAIIGMKVIGLIPISPKSAFDLFASEGHLKGVLSAGSVIFKMLLMVILTVFAAIGSASRAANMIPAEALRVGK